MQFEWVSMFILENKLHLNQALNYVALSVEKKNRNTVIFITQISNEITHRYYKVDLFARSLNRKLLLYRVFYNETCVESIKILLIEL